MRDGGLWILAAIVIAFAAHGARSLIVYVWDKIAEHRRHECAYHEQLERIRDVIGLRPHSPAWQIGDEAVRIIREPILSLVQDPVPSSPEPYAPNRVDELEITYEVRRLWGTCPVCDATHGHACRGDVGIVLGATVDRRTTRDGGVHLGRLQRAPRSLRLEWKP